MNDWSPCDCAEVNVNARLVFGTQHGEHFGKGAAVLGDPVEMTATNIFMVKPRAVNMLWTVDMSVRMIL